MTSPAAPAIEYVHRGVAHRSNDFEVCQVPNCRADGSGTKGACDAGRSMATCMVFILGRPAGGLCARHRREWEQTYDDALFGWPADVPEAVAA